MIVARIKITSVACVLTRSWTRAKNRIFNYLKNGGDDFLFVLNLASLLSLILLFSAMLLESLKLFPARYMSYLIFATIFLGLYVFVSIVERVFVKYFIDFKSTQLFWVGAVAFATYVAHGQAGDEVNAIFHLDASAFPYATTAATAMMMATWALWPAGVVAGLSFMYCTYKTFRSDYKDVLISLVLTLNLTSFALFVGYQISKDDVRKSNIYQIALAMDFNGRFRCENSKVGSDSVAFIGPDQKRALVAPLAEITHQDRRTIFKIVAVPESFEIVDCK